MKRHGGRVEDVLSLFPDARVLREETPSDGTNGADAVLEPELVEEPADPLREHVRAVIEDVLEEVIEERVRAVVQAVLVEVIPEMVDDVLRQDLIEDRARDVLDSVLGDEVRDVLDDVLRSAGGLRQLRHVMECHDCGDGDEW
jgi:hypothetical protein